ncbi:MAG TPA: hypothetical protein VFY41_04145 [Nitrososphaeraceae archaeon]|nr:hypothetical protein [Nitrososphaeraceae archaeon]
MKRPNLLVIISLISFLSIILITGSPFKSSTNSFDNNNPIFLEIPPIQAQDDGDNFEDDGGRDNFAGFEGEDDNDNGEEKEEDPGQFNFVSEDTEDQETDEVEDTEDQETDEVEDTEDQESEGGNDDANDAKQDPGQFNFVSEDTDQQAVDDEVDQETEQQGQQQAVDTDDITDQIQLHGAAGMNDAEQQGQQQAKQLGEGNDVAQQLGQAVSQIGVDKDITQQNKGQQLEQQEAFSSDIEQKISHTAAQIAKSSEDQGSEDSSDVQQVIKQIATQASTDNNNNNDDDVNQIVDQISKQIANGPKSDLAKSLGNLAGLYGSGNKDQVDQAIQQIGTQIAIGDNINQNTIQNIVKKAYQVTNNYFKNKIKVNIDDDDDNDDVKVIKKVYKRDNSCPTQSNSIQLKGKILGKGVIVLADFEPCELRDGRATLNIPNNPHLKFVVLSLDKKGNEYDGIIVTKQKIQSLGKNSGLYVVNFDDEMIGNDPITGKKKTIDEINGLAIYNTATKSLNFNSGNSLALTAVLKT